jgi:cytochrome P450
MAQKHKLPGLFYIDLWPLGPEQLIITDPAFANEYVTARKLPKHQLVATYLDPIVGKGNIIACNGPRWKRLHDMLAPAFSAAQTFEMTGLIAEEAKVFHESIGKKVLYREAMLLEPMISALAFDIIFKLIFGMPANAQTKRNRDLENLNTIVEREFAIRNSWNPFTRRHLDQDKRVAIKCLDKSIVSQVQGRFDEIKRDNIDLSQKRGLSIIDLILREKIQVATSASLDSDFMEMAVNNIKALFLAGSGTITDTLCFTFMLLSVHPAILSELRDEHARVFSSDFDTIHTTLQNNPQKLKELEYTTKVLREALRIYPIGNTGRAPDTPGYITYNGKQYPTKANTLICPVQHTWQMSEKIFPQPDSFNPDRWTNMDKAGTIAWRPFERGNRACIGQGLAMEEMKTVLLYTVQFFHFTCYDLKPNRTPRVDWTSMDTVFGDRAFQQFLTEAKPRDGMPMTVTRV